MVPSIDVGAPPHQLVDDVGVAFTRRHMKGVFPPCGWDARRHGTVTNVVGHGGDWSGSG